MAQMFSPHFPQLKESLLATISSIISTNGECFDAPAQGTLPEILSIYDFMEFISFEDAEEIRTQSIEFGQLVHWNLQDPAHLAVQDFNKSEAIQKIARIRTQLSSSLPTILSNSCSHSGVQVSRSPQKEVELTLDDFPVRKHEKKAKKTPAKTVQKPKSVKATVTKKKATSPIKHVYSLRNRRPTQQ
ncbi:hypothetical protein B0H14DRAFT_2947209 [Mycena olivaceomarginata]|nr:hypothetical protein B0H14DRAFT_2947209 [Mycena olivaceomarginata]